MTLLNLKFNLKMRQLIIAAIAALLLSCEPESRDVRIQMTTTDVDSTYFNMQLTDDGSGYLQIYTGYFDGYKELNCTGIPKNFCASLQIWSDPFAADSISTVDVKIFNGNEQIWNHHYEYGTYSKSDCAGPGFTVDIMSIVNMERNGSTINVY